MNEMLVPLMPAAVWFMACGFLILLLVIVLGYHLYQRSRMKALGIDSASVGELAARREMLNSELEELRRTIVGQKEELAAADAERRKLELFRADLARMEKLVGEKKRESETALAHLASIDNQLARRKMALGRLDGEIDALELRKKELEPMEASLSDLRAELERGNVKLAQLAEQELKVGALMHQARDLAREIEDLTHTLEPLRQEKNRLRLFVEQARHASAVKNEQILEQNREIKALEERLRVLEEDREKLEGVLAELEADHKEKQAAFEQLRNGVEDFEEERRSLVLRQDSELEEKRQAVMAELDAAVSKKEERLDVLVEQIQLAQIQLEQLLLRKDERLAEVASLSGRVAILRREAEKLAGGDYGREPRLKTRRADERTGRRVVRQRRQTPKRCSFEKAAQACWQRI